MERPSFVDRGGRAPVSAAGFRVEVRDRPSCGTGPAPRFADKVRIYENWDDANLISAEDASDTASWPRRDVITRLMETVVYDAGVECRRSVLLLPARVATAADRADQDLAMIGLVVSPGELGHSGRMRTAVWTASRVLALCLAIGAMTSCDSDADSDNSTGSPRSVEPATGQGTVTDQPFDDMAEAASEAANAIDSPPLLRIRNQTSQVVVLTSADKRTTNIVGPGKSVQLMSKRACGWIPLTASTEDGELIVEYAEPCRGQTWTITDN